MRVEFLALLFFLFAPLLNEAVHKSSLLGGEKGEFTWFPVQFHDCIVAIPGVSVFLL